jgi:hypothetical protein
LQVAAVEAAWTAGRGWVGVAVHFMKFIMKFTSPESSTKFHEIYQARCP